MKKIFVLLLLISQSAFASLLPFDLPQANGAGGTYHSSDHPSSVFVVEAFFYTCEHCNNNAPRVNEFAAKYSAEPRVQVLDVGIDRQDSYYTGWLKAQNPNHPVLKDKTKALIGKLGTSGYPSTYVITCQGDVSYSTVGEWSSNTPVYLDQAIRSALALKCPARQIWSDGL